METLFADRPAKPPKTWRFWLFVLSPVLILGMCSVFVMKAKRALSKIQPAIEAFHERIESEQYAAIYAAAAPAFQRATPLNTLENYLGGIRKKTGACQPPPKYGSYLANANSNTEGTTIQVQMRVVCSNGPLDENIVFVFDQEVPKLLSYDASSPFVSK